VTVPERLLLAERMVVLVLAFAAHAAMLGALWFDRPRGPV
jgi:hypothetical protein